MAYETGEPRIDPWGWVFLVIGLGSVGNALWMLAGPMHWYTDLPAAVPHTGPFNPHFVRDIGCAFLTVGIALIWAALRRDLRTPLVSVATLFMGAHAVLHVYDTASGNLDTHHWWLDFPLVHLPAMILIYAAAGLLRSGPAEGSPPSPKEAT